MMEEGKKRRRGRRRDTLPAFQQLMHYSRAQRVESNLLPATTSGNNNATEDAVSLEVRAPSTATR